MLKESVPDLQKAMDDIQCLKRIIDIEAALCGVVLSNVKQVYRACGFTEETIGILVSNQIVTTLNAAEVDLPKALLTSKEFIIQQVVAYIQREDEVTSPDEVLKTNLHLETFLGDIQV